MCLWSELELRSQPLGCAYSDSLSCCWMYEMLFVLTLVTWSKMQGRLGEKMWRSFCCIWQFNIQHTELRDGMRNQQRLVHPLKATTGGFVMDIWPYIARLCMSFRQSALAGAQRWLPVTMSIQTVQSLRDQIDSPASSSVYSTGIQQANKSAAGQIVCGNSLCYIITQNYGHLMMIL